MHTSTPHAHLHSALQQQQRLPDEPQHALLRPRAQRQHQQPAAQPRSVLRQLPQRHPVQHHGMCWHGSSYMATTDAYTGMVPHQRHQRLQGRRSGHRPPPRDLPPHVLWQHRHRLPRHASGRRNPACHAGPGPRRPLGVWHPHPHRQHDRGRLHAHRVCQLRSARPWGRPQLQQPHPRPAAHGQPLPLRAAVHSGRRVALWRDSGLPGLYVAPVW